MIIDRFVVEYGIWNKFAFLIDGVCILVTSATYIFAYKEEQAISWH